jgi:beta-lactam-binding protein with PASTA domain
MVGVLALAGCNRVSEPPGPPDTTGTSLAEATGALRAWCGRVQIVPAAGVLPVGLDPAALTVRHQQYSPAASAAGAANPSGNGGRGCPRAGTPVVTLRLGTDMPNVVGSTVRQARLALAARGLDVKVQLARSLGEDSPVLSQDPAAGQPVDLDRFGAQAATITPGVAVPELAGLPINNACALLRPLGLRCATQFDEKLGSLLVGAQDPAAKTVVAVGSAVTVQPGTQASSLVDVPPVTDRLDAQACAILEKSGLGCVIVSGTAPATVTEQLPAAGTVVAPGSAVYLVLQARAVVVPDVVGRTQAEACDAIAAVDLLCATDPAARGERPGEVLAQDPAGNTTVDPRATVTVQVANPPLIVVPDVRNQQRDSACQTLTGQQLACGLPPGGKDGVVTGQNPAPGTPVPAGTLVTLELPVATTVPPWLYGAVGVALLVVVAGGAIAIQRARRPPQGGTPQVSVRLAVGLPAVRSDGLREW